MELSGETCSFCHDTLDAEQETCAGCQARYHFECLHDELNGVCGVLGCGAEAPENESADCRHCGRGFVASAPRTCRECKARYHLDCLRGPELNRRCAACSTPISTRDRAPAKTAPEPAPAPTPRATSPSLPEGLVPWATLTSALGLLLLLPGLLALVVALSMADHGGPPELLRWSITAVVVGGALAWLSSTGCQRCQRLFSACEVSKRDLGRRERASQEHRDGRFRTVTRTVHEVEVSLTCARCGHSWTQVRSRTVRERVGWW